MRELQWGRVRILYEAQDEGDARLILQAMEEQLPRLFDFFGIDGFRRDKTIRIYPTVAAWSAHKLETAGYYEDWMIGEQTGDDLRFLSHGQCVTTEAHAGQTEEEFRALILHELVHACQQEVDPVEREETEWFWEALATNLSGQTVDAVAITCSYEDLMYHFENIDGLYETFYTMGRYLLLHRSRQEVLAWIREPELLLREGAELFARAAAWSREL